MRRLIVNADDFGRSPGVTRGILDAHRKGIVTSTSVMINQPDVFPALETALRDTPHLGYGLHIALTGGGVPISERHTIPTLLTDEGTFPATTHWLRHYDTLNPAEIEREVVAQIDLFTRTAGRPPDHLDCHDHCLFLIPNGLRVLIRLANERDLPIRNPGFNLPFADVIRVTKRLRESVSPEFVDQVAPQMTAIIEANPPRRMPDRYERGFYNKTATLGDLLLMLTGLADGTTELVCHPGYVDDGLTSSYREKREDELAALTHASAREVIKSEGIALIKFSDLEAAHE